MADKSAIEWTDATWNPIVGCSIKSPGCANCYAMPMAKRIEAMFAGTNGAPQYRGLTVSVKGKPVFTGKVALAPDHMLTQPLRGKRGRKIFVNSMGDLFHENVPDEWIDRVFAVMGLCPQHTFQVLTKRAERMRAYFAGGRQVHADRFDDRATCIKAQAYLLGPLHRYDDDLKAAISIPLRNVWLGVSTERQQEADERIPHLLATPAAVRFISAEPLLGPIDLNEVIPNPIAYNFKHGFDGLDWVIVGGESGHDARPMHPDWTRALRDQCCAAGVPFFFKQWGEWGRDTGPPAEERDRIFEGSASCAVWHGERWSFHDNGYQPDAFAGVGEWVYRLGKKAAGRLLDGNEHNEFPTRVEAS